MRFQGVQWLQACARPRTWPARCAILPAVSNPDAPRWLDAGDTAFTVEFGAQITPAALHAVGALDAAIANAMAAGALPGVVETMPTFRSLTVFYDPLATSRAVLQPVVQALLDSADGALAAPVQHWRLPICYEGDCGPDLADTAAAAGLQVDDVVALHSATRLQVYMLGFLPGFPFMGDLPAALQRPRRTQPRVRVPAGSVSVANQLCAIYPWESPGGWHLLGRCPVPLFDARRPVPALLAPGDRVQFQPVPWAEFQRLQAAAQGGDIDPATWREAGR